jgi:hypothetical protein
MPAGVRWRLCKLGSRTAFGGGERECVFGGRLAVGERRLGCAVAGLARWPLRSGRQAREHRVNALNIGLAAGGCGFVDGGEDGQDLHGSGAFEG